MDSLPDDPRSVEDSRDSSYCCPCGRPAKLVPIYLTEAFGCDQCPRMFVLESDGQLVEQGGGYPQSRRWRWQQQHWQVIVPPPGPDHRWQLLFRISCGLLLLIMGWGLLGNWLIAPWNWLYWGLGMVALIDRVSRLRRWR
jgi:hypothetical protein